METPTTFRVYGRQWAVEARYPSAEEAQAAAEAQFGGRLSREAVEVREDRWRSHVWAHAVWACRWSPLAEVRSRVQADLLAAALAARDDVQEVAVVQRNSAEEHALAREGRVRAVGA